MKHRWKKMKRLWRGVAGLCLAAVVAGGGFAVAAGDTESTPGVDVPVLMYHSILEQGDGNDYCLPAAVFRADMEYLKEHGYQTVFVSDLVAFVCEQKPLPEKPVVITLDDGYLNGLTAVLPILEELDMKATISVVGSYTEKSIAENDPNPSYAYLTWEDIRALASSGRVEIGSHTYAMHDLGERRGAERKCWESEGAYQAALRADLERLQTCLTQRSGVTPSVFAYPYGFVSVESRPVLKELGFTAALTCAEKINHLTNDPEQLYTLGRFNRPSGVTTADFMARVGLG